MNMTVQLSTPYIDPECQNTHRRRQTDRQMPIADNTVYSNTIA